MTVTHDDGMHPTAHQGEHGIPAALVGTRRSMSSPMWRGCWATSFPC